MKTEQQIIAKLQYMQDHLRLAQKRKNENENKNKRR